MPAPESIASFIFREALGSLMAHSIRAVVNQFRKKNIALDIAIAPDLYNVIGFDGTNGRISLLRTRFSPLEKPHIGRVSALIMIHKDAGKNLARICIAHELFHLWCELHQFSETKEWGQVPSTAEMESACDQFAAHLCKTHDEFNRSESSRSAHIYFPDGSFDEVVTNKESGRVVWPSSIGLNPEAPFYKVSQAA